MPKSKASVLSVDLISTKGNAAPSEPGAGSKKDTVAVTVRLPVPLYRRLKEYGIRVGERTSRTNQSIMVEALVEYLDGRNS